MAKVRVTSQVVTCQTIEVPDELLRMDKQNGEYFVYPINDDALDEIFAIAEEYIDEYADIVMLVDDQTETILYE